jgi:hypothetical protein
MFRIRFNLVGWIRIRISIGNTVPDLEPGGPKKCYKSEENFSFEVLDVLFTQGKKNFEFRLLHDLWKKS